MYCNPSELQMEELLREHLDYPTFHVIICTAASDQHSHYVNITGKGYYKERKRKEQFDLYIQVPVVSSTSFMTAYLVLTILSFPGICMKLFAYALGMNFRWFGSCTKYS